MAEKLLLVVGKHVAKWGEKKYNFGKEFKITSQFMNTMHFFFQPLDEKKDWNIKLIFSKHRVYTYIVT